MNTLEQLTNGTYVYTNAVHRFGTDALVLARFSLPRRNETAVDLCAGCGIVSLEWHDNGHTGTCYAVEIDADASALTQQSIQQTGAENIQIYTHDLRTFRLAQNVDVIACNPPYFTAGKRSMCAQRATARHEEMCTLQDVCQAAKQMLKDGGKLCMCIPPHRMAELMYEMKNNRIEPKRLCFVRNNKNSAPWLCLIEGQKNRAVGLVIGDDICLQNEDGTPTPHAQYGKEPQ